MKFYLTVGRIWNFVASKFQLNQFGFGGARQESFCYFNIGNELILTLSSSDIDLIFRKYLEKAGVLELLTKSLVQLYEEPQKPDDALTYLKKAVQGTLHKILRGIELFFKEKINKVF